MFAPFSLRSLSQLARLGATREKSGRLRTAACLSSELELKLEECSQAGAGCRSGSLAGDEPITFSYFTHRLTDRPSGWGNYVAAVQSRIV